MFTNSKYVKSQLVGEFNFFYKIENPLVWINFFFCDWVRAYIGKSAYAYFHRGEDKDYGNQVRLLKYRIPVLSTTGIQLFFNLLNKL